MTTAIRHASAFKPISVAERADISIDNWDRVTNFVVNTNQPQENLYELGRLLKMATDKDKLEVSVSITQYEYGTLDSFLQLAGLSAMPSGGLDLEDFSETRTDFISPGKDQYGGTVEQTLWVERLALDSFSLAINANQRLERSFSLSGNYCKIARYGNKYVIFKSNDAPSGTSGSYVISVSDPAPVANPNNGTEYILKLYRIRSGVATELDLTTDYTYSNALKQITILSATEGDNFRIWYTSASWGTSGDPQALNDSDNYYINANRVTVYVDDGTNDPVELDQLTLLSINATLNRNGEGAIGTSEDVFNDVESYDVTVDLGGFIKGYPIQEALMVQAGQSWGLIDYNLMDEVAVIVKIYTDSTKETFQIGYMVTGANNSSDSPSDYNANAFGTDTVSLASDNCKISTTEGDLTV